VLRDIIKQLLAKPRFSKRGYARGVEGGLKYSFATIVAIKGMFSVKKEVQITVVARFLTRGAGWGCREPALNYRMKPSAVKAGGTGEAPHLVRGSSQQHK